MPLAALPPGSYLARPLLRDRASNCCPCAALQLRELMGASQASYIHLLDLPQRTCAAILKEVGRACPALQSTAPQSSAPQPV